jgi:hypothetical protein
VQLVIVERRFENPVEFAAIQAIEATGARDLETHRVRFIKSYCAHDRTQMVCLYEAPDAEAVRSAQQQAGMPLASVWACEFKAWHPAPQPPDRRQLVMLERRFPAAASFEDLERTERRGAWCLETHDVLHLESYLSADHRQAVCSFLAPDAETLRHVGRTLRLPHESIWPVTMHTAPRH